MNLEQAEPAGKETKFRRLRLTSFAPSYWLTSSTAQGSDITVVSDLSEKPPSSQDAQLSAPLVSDHSFCTTCDLTFAGFEQQRGHFRTDWHKYNVQRVTRKRPPITEDEFEHLSDLGSHSSLSGTDEESESSDGDISSDKDAQNFEKRTSEHVVRVAERIEFRNPAQDDTFLILYKASLPDETSLASLAHRGSWAVIMTGGGHFCAALWDISGTLIRHKTFHRYTSRRKQGGSQSVADAARGNANRIRSAGATLRRYGEQALENEVHDLLKSWKSDLESAQCIFVRASLRERRDLLLGWNGSPLGQLNEEGRIRNVPIPTRRATLKEATRVYEELSTVIMSPTSLLQTEKIEDKMHADPKPSKASVTSKPSTARSKPAEKGTDHLKKREDKPYQHPKPSVSDMPPEQPLLPPKIDERLLHLFSLCLKGDKESLGDAFIEDPDARNSVFEPQYFPSDERFSKVTEALGFVGVAAAMGMPELVDWLMDQGVDPCLGASPYLATKGKATRNALRRYWAQHPEKYDYAKAGFPSPLADTDVEAQAEKERAKRKKEKQKKKDKAQEKIEASKTPEQRARELRAAAAEARLLGNRCAGCRKPLEGLVPFERLSFKYCSIDCLNKHRQLLNSM